MDLVQVAVMVVVWVVTDCGDDSAQVRDVADAQNFLLSVEFAPEEVDASAQAPCFLLRTLSTVTELVQAAILSAIIPPSRSWVRVD